MKRLLIGLILAVCLLVPVCCAAPAPAPSPTPSPAPPSHESEQSNSGQAFEREILDSLQGSSGWMPPLPPVGGEKPRILTREEKDRVMDIASAVAQVVQAKRNKDVVSVDTQYLWVGWIGHPDGVSYLGYEAVANGIADLSNIGDTWYPGVDFIFNSKFGDFGKAGIHVAVNLETGQVAYIDGFSATVIPPRLPP